MITLEEDSEEGWGGVGAYRHLGKTARHLAREDGRRGSFRAACGTAPKRKRIKST